MKIHKELAMNVIRTINMGVSVWVANVNPLIGVGLMVFNSISWFSDLSWKSGFNKATKNIDARVEAFKRVIDRYLKGEIKVINEQVLDEELSLNRFYK